MDWGTAKRRDAQIVSPLEDVCQAVRKLGGVHLERQLVWALCCALMVLDVSPGELGYAATNEGRKRHEDRLLVRPNMAVLYMYKFKLRK